MLDPIQGSSQHVQHLSRQTVHILTENEEEI